MARGGIRISKILQLTPADIEDRKLTLRSPKSGKEREIVFVPQKVADRLKEYTREQGAFAAGPTGFPNISHGSQKGRELGRNCTLFILISSDTPFGGIRA